MKTRISPWSAICSGIFLMSCLAGYSSTLQPYCQSGPNFTISPNTVAADGTVSINFSIFYTGNSASGPITVAFYLSSSSTINPAQDTLLSSGTIPSLPAGIDIQSYTAPNVGIPSEDVLNPLGGAGTYWIGMTVNGQYHGAGVGCDESQLTITYPLPDLEGFNGGTDFPDAFFAVQPTNTCWGGVVQLNLAIVNFSDGDAGPFVANLYLSTNSFIGTNDYYLATIPFTNGLQGFYYQPHQVTLRLPATNPFAINPPNIFIGMVVDPSNQVSEITKANNSNQGIGIDTASMTLTNAAFPDLEGFSFVSQTNNLFWGGSENLTAEVINASGMSAPPFYVNFYLAFDGTIGDSNSYLLATAFFTNGMPAGGSEELSGDIHLPLVNPFANSVTNFLFGLVMDPYKQVAEINRGNNSNQGVGIDLNPAVILNPSPSIGFTASTLTNGTTILFGNAGVGGAGNSNQFQTVVITNSGAAPLTISNIVLSGNPAFSVVNLFSSIQNFISVSSLPGKISPNGTETWILTLKFAPVTNGPATGTLSVSSSDSLTPLLNLSLVGNGTPVPQIELAPSVVPVDFGNVAENGTATRTITILNDGSGPLTISQNGISMLSGTQFKLITITSTTQGLINLASGPQTIAAGGVEQWNIAVQFQPSGLGHFTDELQLLSNDPTNSALTVPLRGIGVSPMHLLVTDPNGRTNNPAMNFPAIQADGPGKQQASAVLTLQNTGVAPLIIASNGFTFGTGTQFYLSNIVSSIAGPINLSTGAVAIAGSTQEVWTSTIVFDPTVTGALTNALNIHSGDPVDPSFPVPLSGQGISTPQLSVVDSGTPASGSLINFGAVLDDGAGGRTARQTITLQDVGVQPLVVAQNSLNITGSSAFSIVSVVSSTNPSVNIASSNPANRTILPEQNETWTVTVAFDPATNEVCSGTLNIASNDPQTPLVQISLVGTGSVPIISMTSPASLLNISASNTFNFTWQASYPAGDATINLYLDLGNNPNNGLIPVATGISMRAATGQYQWQSTATLVGGPYFVYATISDGTVTNSGFAAGQLQIEPAGSFQLLSADEVTSSTYAFEYLFNGLTYVGITNLSLGENTITVPNSSTGGTGLFQFNVNNVSSLINNEGHAYDALGRLQQVVNGNGIITTFTYDPMSRLVRRSSSNGVVVTYAYDVLGRRTSMTDSTGTTFNQWDSLDRLTAVIMSRSGVLGASDNLTLSYGYDLAGNRTNIVYPGGEQIQYGYDPAGRLLTVNNVTRGLLFNYSYNSQNGLLTQLTRPDGINTLYNYDGMGRLVTIHHQQSNGTLVADYTYALNAAGQATNLTITLPGGIVKQEQYTYDRFNRLAEAIYSAGPAIQPTDKTVTYTYDGNGNRLSMTTVSNNVVTGVLNYQYGNDNRLLQVTDQTGAIVDSFVYDAAGNCIERVTPQKTTFYTYDERNLLTTINDGQNQVTLIYNGDGVRVGKIVNGVVTTVIPDTELDVPRRVEELAADGTVMSSSTMGLDRLAYSSGGSLSYELPDRLGTVRQRAGAGGGVSGEISYDAFGTPSVASTDESADGFAGEEWIPNTDLVFLQARAYFPGAGHFISKDQSGMAGGLNGYVYVNNDPVNLIDPSGLIIDPEIVSIIDPEGYVKVNTKYTDVELQTQNRPGYISALMLRYYALLQNFGKTGRITDKDKTHWQQIWDNLGDNPGDLKGSDRSAWQYLKGALKSIWATYSKTADQSGKPNAGGSIAKYSGIIGKPEKIADLIFTPDPLVDLLRGVTPDVLPPTDAVESSIAPRVQVDNATFASFNLPVPATVAPPITRVDYPRISERIEVGGVLINQTAQIGANSLSDIIGAQLDEVSGQYFLLTTNDSVAVPDLNIDYLASAFATEYGSALPPFANLVYPVSASTRWQDLGNGNGIFEPGENGGFTLQYNPLFYNVDSTVDVEVDATWNGTNYQWTARFNCVPVKGVLLTGNGPFLHPMKLLFASWVNPPPPGVTLDTTCYGSQFCYEPQSAFNTFHENLYTSFTMYNGSSSSYIITGVNVFPAREERQFGGAVDGTPLGWVMIEADRVMGCLFDGQDDLTGATYSSATISVPGYQNIQELGGANVSRIWLSPNPISVQRQPNPVTGEDEIVFDPITFSINYASSLPSVPQSAQTWANEFSSNYNAFASMSFPCLDPNDPTGSSIIYVPVFGLLRDAVKAVSIARLCREAAIPNDMWWLNDSQLPVAYCAKSTPTTYGGSPPNSSTNMPPALQGNANPTAQQTQANNADDATESDGLDQPLANTISTVPLDWVPNMAETDLSFDSREGQPLEFVRYYNASSIGTMNMGPGWRYVPYTLQFEQPSWLDEYSLMKTPNGSNVLTDASFNTRLRQGGIRFIEYTSGTVLDFESSFNVGYSVDNLGNPTIDATGLNSSGVPVFTPGLRQNGCILTQLPGSLEYVLQNPAGDSLTFDFNGRLLQTSTRDGVAQNYTYDFQGRLQGISDNAGQANNLIYNSESNLIVTVTGPAGEQVNYGYDTNNCLISATHVRSGASVTYHYNQSLQLTNKVLFHGLAALQCSPDPSGRAGSIADIRGVTTTNCFTVESNGLIYLTDSGDPQINDPTVVPWERQMDGYGRLISERDATGATTTYGYNSNSFEPNFVTLPIPGRATITIQRNAIGQPTQITDPSNIGAHDVTAIYNSTNALLQEIIDESNRVTQLGYTSNNDLALIRSYLGIQNADVTFGYSLDGALQSITNPLGIRVLSFQRDNLDRITNVVDPTGVKFGFRYDTLDRLSEVIDPRLSGPIQYFYDNFDRLIQVQYPVGSIFYGYDPVTGWLTAETNLLGQATHYIRDPRNGDVLQSIDIVPGGSNFVTTLTYNRYGAYTSVTPPGSEPTTFNYDTLGRLIGTTQTNAVPPGTPLGILCNNAISGVPTHSTSFVFSWGAPASDGGVSGYNYSMDQSPSQNINTAVATALFSNVSIGTHVFEVQAKGNNGLWGPPAQFNLIVASNLPPQLTIAGYGTNIVLSWPTNSVGFWLESATNLSRTAVWITPTNLPQTIGGKFYMTNAISAPARFYRLSNQPNFATSVVGAIGFGGDLTFNTISAATATAVVNWTNTQVLADSGSFPDFVTPIASAIFNSSQAWSLNTAAPITNFWSVGGFTFELSSSSILGQGGTAGTSGYIILTGTGIVSRSGFLPTDMFWFLTAQDPPVSPSEWNFSFSCVVQ